MIALRIDHAAGIKYDGMMFIFWFGGCMSHKLRRIFRLVSRVAVVHIFLLTALFLALPVFAASYSHTYPVDKPEVRTLPDGTAVVELDGAIQDTSVVGAPIVPMLTSRLYVPSGEAVDRVEVSFGPLRTLPGTYLLAHGTTPRPTNDPSPPPPEKADPAIYSSDTPYPPTTWRRVSEQTLHGYRLVPTDLYPVRYLPASGIVQYAESVTVTVYASPSKTVDHGRLAPRAGNQDKQSVMDLIDNDETLAAEGEKTSAAPTATDRQYLLVTTAALQSAFAPLVAHRASSAGGGFTTASVTVETIAASQTGRDLPEKIRNYIKDSYANHGTQFVVLGGDADGPQAQQAVPTRGAACFCDDYVPADFYYACLDGTWDNNGNSVFGESTDGVGGGDIDWLAEVAVGRIPADTADEAHNAIAKIIAYETGNNPFRTLLVGEYLDSKPTWGGDRLDYVYEAMSIMPRDTLYDRDHPSHEWPKTTLQSLLSSNSYSMVFHEGHSNTTYNMKMYNADLDAVTNNKYFFVYSAGCYSNSFDNRSPDGYLSTDSIGEDFVVRNQSSAFAYIGNSRLGWYDPNTPKAYSTLVQRRFVEALFQSSIRQIGFALNYARANLDYTTGYYRCTGLGLNIMGDPASSINTCDDNSIIVSIQNPVQKFTVHAGLAMQLRAKITKGCGDSLTNAHVSATFSTGESAVSLYDDGAHQDGAVGDGVYGGTWTPHHIISNMTVTITASKSGYVTGTRAVTGTVTPHPQYSLSFGTYEWISNAGGKTVLTRGNEVFAYVPLGFGFKFYGTTYDNVYVNDNGTLSFINYNVPGDNVNIPYSDSPNGLIAVFWDDLVIPEALSGNVSYKKIGSSPNSYGVFTWENVCPVGSCSDSATFQVVISERTGTITFQYADVSFGNTSYDGGAGATVGIENQRGKEGVQYSYNQAVLNPGQALVFAPWTDSIQAVLQLLLLN
ncbi:MAG: C25 family cysteine peptidase [Desulfovibrionaceae bacterium]|nr:C25 family cysteine peptidase [Desulfovibrionaceae bacterium]